MALCIFLILTYPLLQGALFESNHCDINLVETISHKCEVLAFYNNKNEYHLVGSYNAKKKTVKFAPGAFVNLEEYLEDSLNGPKKNGDHPNVHLLDIDAKQNIEPPKERKIDDSVSTQEHNSDAISEVIEKEPLIENIMPIITKDPPIGNNSSSLGSWPLPPSQKSEDSALSDSATSRPDSPSGSSSTSPRPTALGKYQ